MKSVILDVIWFQDPGVCVCFASAFTFEGTCSSSWMGLMCGTCILGGGSHTSDIDGTLGIHCFCFFLFQFVCSVLLVMLPPCCIPLKQFWSKKSINFSVKAYTEKAYILHPMDCGCVLSCIKMRIPSTSPIGKMGMQSAGTFSRCILVLLNTYKALKPSMGMRPHVGWVSLDFNGPILANMDIFTSCTGTNRESVTVVYVSAGMHSTPHTYFCRFTSISHIAGP